MKVLSAIRVALNFKKEMTITSVGNDVEKLECLCSAGRNAN
jgi:hypothetical protein